MVFLSVVGFHVSWSRSPNSKPAIEMDHCSNQNNDIGRILNDRARFSLLYFGREEKNENYHLQDGHFGMANMTETKFTFAYSTRTQLRPTFSGNRENLGIADVCE